MAKEVSPHGLHGNWLEDVLAAANTHAEASERCEKSGENRIGSIESSKRF